MTSGTRCFIVLLWVGVSLLRAEEIPHDLPAAKSGQPYAYALETSQPATFVKLNGDADWLTVSSDGLLSGTPRDEQRFVTITVRATPLESSDGKKELIRTFRLEVKANLCRENSHGGFAWCDSTALMAQQRPVNRERFSFEPSPIGWTYTANQPDFKWLDFKGSCEKTTGCIVQFDRLKRDTLPPDDSKHSVPERDKGTLGSFNKTTHHIDYIHDTLASLVSHQHDTDHDSLAEDVVKAIDGSKAFLSGSVMIRTQVPSCSFLSWSIVAQTTDSSNNLYYGPTDLSTFCVDRDGGTVLIVLPVHAIWADAYGVPANVNDPTWKTASAPPALHECWTGVTPDSPADENWPGIRPCDSISNRPNRANAKLYAEEQLYAKRYSDEKTNPIALGMYSPLVRWAYNRFAEPGVSQGAISIAPIDLTTKSTMDVQVYGSSLLGPGWLGAEAMYEQDRNPFDDLNSLTASMSYDFRIPPGTTKPYLDHLRWAPKGDLRIQGKEVEPPYLGVRPPEFVLRAGGEWSPDSFSYSCKQSSGCSDSPSVPVPQYLARNTNIVTGATLKLPVALNPIQHRIDQDACSQTTRQPAQILVAPVFGLEGGVRVKAHEICEGAIDSSSCTKQSQPTPIYRRVYGVDLSERWPWMITRNFLGDRPVTVDYSYRMRELTYKEPFANQEPSKYELADIVDGQSAGGRSYSRVTYIEPVSAYLQLRVTWQHGSLPPLFQYVGSQVTIGITFSNPGYAEH